MLASIDRSRLEEPIASSRSHNQFSDISASIGLFSVPVTRISSLDDDSSSSFFSSPSASALSALSSAFSLARLRFALAGGARFRSVRRRCLPSHQRPRAVLPPNRPFHRRWGRGSASCSADRRPFGRRSGRRSRASSRTSDMSAGSCSLHASRTNAANTLVFSHCGVYRHGKIPVHNSLSSSGSRAVE